LEKKKEPRIIDVSGKDSIECPSCGLVSKIPPRTISMEELKHMQDNQNFMEELHKNTAQNQGIISLGRKKTPHFHRFLKHC